MSGIIFMLLLVLLPSLMVTPLLGARNVSSLAIVVLMRRLLILSLMGLLLLLLFSDNEGVDWYFGLAIIWAIVFGVSYWIINKLTILILEKRDALYGAQLAALGIRWWEFKKWNAVRMYVRNSSEALERAREIGEMNCSDDAKSEKIEALLPFDYYSKGVNPGWVGVIPAINVCENIYEVAKIYKGLSLSNSKALEWFSEISIQMHGVMTGLESHSEPGNVEETLTRIVHLWVKSSTQWIIQLVHVLSYDKAATVAWVLLKGLYGMQKKWSFMVPVYKQMLQYIHKELVDAFACLNSSMIPYNPMQIVYVSALDKLQELDVNNKDLSKYRHEACTANLLDLIREDIILARKNM